MRVAITGPPRTGKTTLAEELVQGRFNIVHTDDYVGLGWSGASDFLAAILEEHARDRRMAIMMEGVAVPRALRKWLRRNPTGKPIDRLIFLFTPREQLTEGQIRMGKGVLTVFGEIRRDLERRGVVIEERL